MLAKLKTLLFIIKAELADIWQKSKMYLLGIAAIIVAIEFQKIKAALLVYAGQKEIVKDKKEDASLAAKESSENAQADALVQQAQDEPSKEESINDDWNKK